MTLHPRSLLDFLLYEENVVFFFISVEKMSRDQREVKKRREIGGHTG
jgi:hypothetical protein